MDTFVQDIERAAAITCKEPLVMVTRREIRYDNVPTLLTENRLYHLGLPRDRQAVREQLRELPSFEKDGTLPRELRITAVQTTVAMGTPTSGIHTIAWLCGYNRNEKVYTVIGLARFMFGNPYQVALQFLTTEERAVLGRMYLTHLA